MLVMLFASQCGSEKKGKDRSEATDMFERICEVTQDYTEKLEDAPDSAAWSATCKEYEDSLGKINFSYPPDTDLLLTEGQNDTIETLMREYVKIRQQRIQDILYPEAEADTLALDSLEMDSIQADASRSRGN